MVKNHFVYLPLYHGSFENEWEQCLDQIATTIKSGYVPVRLTVFVDQPDYPSYVKIKKYLELSLKQTFKGKCPAFGVTLHPPEGNLKVAVEGLFVRNNVAEIESKTWQSIPYVILKSGSHFELWCSGIGSDQYPFDTRKASTEAFEAAISILDQEGMTFDNIIRQWNYIGEILKLESGFQNYQIFNEVRSDYYGKHRTIGSYPAATGIGMKHGGVFLDIFAVKGDRDIWVKAVNNPNQINAYEYGQRVLKGLNFKGIGVKNPPRFERALILGNKKETVMLISGTASIIGQETIGKGDVREQTLVTIENINKLTNIEHLSQILGNNDIQPGRYTFVRVYVRNRNDFGEVKKICEDHFPGVPAAYVEADICRDDLLTEIEAEYLL